METLETLRDPKRLVETLGDRWRPWETGRDPERLVETVRDRWRP